MLTSRAAIAHVGVEWAAISLVQVACRIECITFSDNPLGVFKWMNGLVARRRISRRGGRNHAASFVRESAA
jgi:hypothetical protein